MSTVNAAGPKRDQHDVGYRPTVLIVDDRAENLLALEAVIETLDIKVMLATSGEDALRRLLTDDVAVIILDVQMPGLDGFETAAHIKRREKTKHIPILFLTALSTDIDHMLRGYDSGAVDYISKPFNPEVLRAKLSVFIELHRHERLIEEQNALLSVRLTERDRAQAALARQTAELERSNAELERFATIIAEDLSEPMYVVAGFLDILRDQHADLFSEPTATMVERADAAAQQMFTRVDELLRYARATNDVRDHGTVDLTEAFDDALRGISEVVSERGLSVTADPLPLVVGDAAQLGRLFAHVIGHAINQPGTTEVHVGVSRRGDDWVLTVRDDGPGIDEAVLPSIFSLVASQTSSDDKSDDASRELSLPIARRIVEHHGGRIWAQSMPGRGTTISFTLPTAEATA
jgi:two-component system, sensor histidine kinase and response regulator